VWRIKKTILSRLLDPRAFQFPCGLFPQRCRAFRSASVSRAHRVYSSKRWEREKGRERKGSSALEERGSEKHKGRDPSAGKKSYKNRISFFFGSHFFFEISFFWEGGGWQREKKGTGACVMVNVEREAKNRHQRNRLPGGGGR
jgi:hypothetical protein